MPEDALHHQSQNRSAGVPEYREPRRSKMDLRFESPWKALLENVERQISSVETGDRRPGSRTSERDYRTGGSGGA